MEFLRLDGTLFAMPDRQLSTFLRGGLVGLKAWHAKIISAN